MSDTEPAATQTPKKPKRVRSPNLRIPVSKQNVVAAMLSQKIPYRSIQDAVGISLNTIQKVKHQEVASSEQAEKIKKGLRNRWAVLADASLTTLTDDKLADASAKDLAYIAAKATEMAGLSPPSIVETYTKSIQSFLIQETPQPIAVAESHTKTVQCTEVNSA